MTLPPEVLEDLAAFKAKLPTVVRKKRVRRPQREGPTVTPEPKPTAVREMTPRQRAELADRLDPAWYHHVCESGMPEAEFVQQLEARVDVKPKADTVRRNGPKSWLVMLPTGAAYRGMKSREDPVVRDAPITKAPYNVSHMDGNTARICTDAQLFKRSK